MMVAMMFPTAAPMILTFHRIQSGKRARGEVFVSTWLFVAGYTAVWVRAGIVAYLGAVAAEMVAARAALSAAAASRIGGVLLVAAGLYQLTPRTLPTFAMPVPAMAAPGMKMPGTTMPAGSAAMPMNMPGGPAGPARR